MRKWIAATALITAMTATGLAQDVEKGSNDLTVSALPRYRARRAE